MTVFQVKGQSHRLSTIKSKEKDVTRPIPNVWHLGWSQGQNFITRAGLSQKLGFEARRGQTFSLKAVLASSPILASRPRPEVRGMGHMLRDWGQILALRPNKNVNHVILVLCIALKVRVLSSKSRPWINNLCVLTPSPLQDSLWKLLGAKA